MRKKQAKFLCLQDICGASQRDSIGLCETLLKKVIKQQQQSINKMVPHGSASVIQVSRGPEISNWLQKRGY